MKYFTVSLTLTTTTVYLLNVSANWFMYLNLGHLKSRKLRNKYILWLLAFEFRWDISCLLSGQILLLALSHSPRAFVWCVNEGQLHSHCPRWPDGGCICDVVALLSPVHRAQLKSTDGSHCLEKRCLRWPRMCRCFLWGFMGPFTGSAHFGDVS